MHACMRTHIYTNKYLSKIQIHTLKDTIIHNIPICFCSLLGTWVNSSFVVRSRPFVVSTVGSVTAQHYNVSYKIILCLLPQALPTIQVTYVIILYKLHCCNRCFFLEKIAIDVRRQ